MNSKINLLEQQNKKLLFLYEVALTLGKSLEIEATLAEVLARIIDFLGADSGVIYVINENTLEMVPVSCHNLSQDVIDDINTNKVRVGECLCGSIADCNEELFIFEKASKHKLVTRDSQKKAEMEFYAGLPLKSKGKVIGVLCIIAFRPLEPDEQIVDLLRAATVPISLAIENSRLFENTLRQLEENLKYSNFEGIIASNGKMLEILNFVRKIKDFPTNVLIYGESGTGKELIARALHFNSLRKDKPFIAINCPSIPENLLESELFGYLKGAFTGAYVNKKGLFEVADGGTIFLDEIEALNKTLQVKLLRFLQDRTFFKIGSTNPVTVDVKIIAATNRLLEEAVKAKDFREDLYYRLNVLKIELPPLRERSEDIPLLTRYFISTFSKKTGKNVRRISHDAQDILLNHSWPGNIRELQNIIERAVIVAETDQIEKKDLPILIATNYNDVRKFWSLKNVEREHILKVMSMVQGNKSKASRLLGINTTTLWRILKEFDSST